MKYKKDKNEQTEVASPEDQSRPVILEEEEPVLCEIDDKSGQPTCCGPGDLSKISTPVIRNKK